jgi:hypothetical protein
MDFSSCAVPEYKIQKRTLRKKIDNPSILDVAHTCSHTLYYIGYDSQQFICWYSLKVPASWGMLDWHSAYSTVGLLVANGGKKGGQLA